MKCWDNADDVDMQMKAGLRNLLGLEENRMAKQLQAAREVSADMKRCLADTELEMKLTMEELAKSQSEKMALAEENNKLQEQLVAAMKEIASENESTSVAESLEAELASVKAELALAKEAAATGAIALPAKLEAEHA